MNRRTIELLLLLAATPVVLLLFGMLALSQTESLSWESFGVPLGLLGAFILAHIATRFLTPNADPAILPIVFVLSGIGIAFVMRLAPELATKQLIWLFLSIACMIAVMALVRDLDKLARYKYTLMIIGVVLLLSPLIPGIGTEIYGSRIWLTIGPLSFQPGEIAKVAIVLFLGAYLSYNREELSIFTVRIGPFDLPDLRTLAPLLVMWGIALIIVIFEKDLGSAMVFFCVFLVMLYVASGKKVYPIIGLLLAAVAAVFLYLAFSHVQTRVQTWIDPFEDATGGGYQLVQALYSMADGGLFGVGIGKGLSTLIPVVESDFIFAAICEETGLLGAAAVLLLFLCFAIRGLTTAARAKSDVSALIATGLTTSIALQAFIIIGGVTRLIPLTGLTLPFMSQGGSSLLASFIAVGLLLRCGSEATGTETEISSTGYIHANSVLGRVSLGKRLTATIVFFSILFALLVANLTMIMVVQADTYRNMSSNNHTIIRESRSKRGAIQTSDGVILAQSVLQSDGTYERVYPEGDMASQVVGYASTTYGTSGIESSYNDELKGNSSFATWEDVVKSLSGARESGNDVTLTINSVVQEAAQSALEGYNGACIVIDPQTGEVLASASAPTYDINNVADILSSSSSSSGALFNRVTQALYAPGSTFKIVSLASALENGVASEETIYDAPATIDIGNAPVTNFGNKSYGTITLRRATELSANTVYGQVGEQIGAKRLVTTAEKFLFNKEISFDIPVSTSLMPNSDEMTTWETAWAAAGEPVGEHESPAGPQATVLEMALVGCAIANDGEIVQPYLVQSIHNVNGEASYTASTKTLTRALSSDIAQRVSDVLKGVVENGTGTGAQVSGATVIGKTGTAEKGTDKDDSWFVGYASVNGRGVVIAIVLEDSESGTAANRSANVMKTALTVRGLL